MKAEAQPTEPHRRVPPPPVGILCVVINCILSTVLSSPFCGHPHFTDTQAETQRGQVTSPGHTTRELQRQNLIPGILSWSLYPKAHDSPVLTATRLRGWTLTILLMQMKKVRLRVSAQAQVSLLVVMESGPEAWLLRGCGEGKEELEGKGTGVKEWSFPSGEPSLTAVLPSPSYLPSPFSPHRTGEAWR